MEKFTTEKEERTIKPLKDVKEFSSQLKGCIKGSSIDPLHLKKIWRF